ncbi:MAG: hypothetical protein JWQ73_160 [Variovorax sp.]|nr:hypothetical protein [Variovorax sp.]
MRLNRLYIMVGDPTTVGGHVITGSDVNTWHGRQMAAEGDQIDCPACSSIGIIRSTGDRSSVSSKDQRGREQALNGDLCICRCRPPPLLIATQNSYGIGVHSDALPSVGGAFDELRIEATKSIDEKLRAIDTETGQALAGLAYFIKSSSGAITTGYTDASGMCPRIKTDSVETLTVWFGVSAIEMMNREVK